VLVVLSTVRPARRALIWKCRLAMTTWYAGAVSVMVLALSW
jgi:hypothetical protein